MHRDEQERRLRRRHHWLLVLVVLSIAAGRIAVVKSREGDTAFLSANDRSRWCTVAALVEDGTYEIDRLIEIRSVRNRRPWATIDRVMHRGADGQIHSYSSKPPLFPTMVAGLYAVFHGVTGMTLTAQPLYATRILLALVNLPLLAIFCLCTIASLERLGTSYWPRRIAAIATCFATMIFPFTITLNNHLPAAAFTALVLWLYVSACERIDHEVAGESSRFTWKRWLVAGAAAAFVVANELPALSMFCLWGLLFLLLDPRSIVPYAAGAFLVAAAFFGTNYLAHQSFRPPYAHRGVGPKIAEIAPAQDLETLAASVADGLRQTQQIPDNARVWIEPSDDPSRYRAHTDQDHRFAVVPISSLSQGSPALSQGAVKRPEPNATAWSLHHWDDWYEYPGSYWQEGRRSGVDVGEPDRAKYLFHATFGHYGVFSITPIWLLVPIGCVLGLRFGTSNTRRLFAAISLASLVCFIFYMMRPEIDRNYGGVSVCFRWMLWFAPLWLYALVPGLNSMWSSPAGRAFICVVLAISVFSVSTALETPWQHPWIYRYWAFLGWLD